MIIERAESKGGSSEDIRAEIGEEGGYNPWGNPITHNNAQPHPLPTLY